MVNGCYLCKQNAETCSHIVLWCLVVYKLWTMVYNLFGIKWVIVGSVREDLWAWKGLCKKRTQLKLIPLTIFWVIQKEPNNRVFDGIESELTRIRDRWLHLFGSVMQVMTCIGEVILRMLQISLLRCKYDCILVVPPWCLLIYFLYLLFF